MSNFTQICSKCGATCGVIFRYTRTEPKTGKVIRFKRPMPIPVCNCSEH